MFAWLAIELAFFHKTVCEIELISILKLRQLVKSESDTINFTASKEFLFLACRAIEQIFIFNAPQVFVLLIFMRFVLEDCYDLLDVIPLETGNWLIQRSVANLRVLLLDIVFYFDICRQRQRFRLTNGLLFFLFIFVHRLIVENLWDNLLLHLVILNLS